MLIILGFLMAFGITWAVVPSIVNISKLKGICSLPNGRTSHTGATPTLGGIAVFTGFILSTVIFAGTYFEFELKYIISGLIIVFFLGIKDDILVVDPLKKLACQIFAAVLIVVFADIRITGLYGLFGIEQLPYIFSVALTVFAIIVIINSFNLIDGIDGLASGIGILTSSVFGIWFLITGNTAYAIFSFSFVGALTAFFWFNVFSKKNKIFLGDTGSQVTGLVAGILACRFLELEPVTQGTINIASAPACVLGILVIPLFDAFRVFVLRIYQGRSPFKADRQHAHHLLLRLGNTHLNTTFILTGVNLIFIVLSWLLRGIGIIWLTCIILGLAGLMSHILVTLAEKRTNEVNDRYNFLEIWREIYKKKKTTEKIPGRDIVLKPLEKVNTGLN